MSEYIPFSNVCHVHCAGAVALLYFAWIFAGVAQLAEQGFCKPQVGGSSPSASSFFHRKDAETAEKNPVNAISE